MSIGKFRFSIILLMSFILFNSFTSYAIFDNQKTELTGYGRICIEDARNCIETRLKSNLSVSAEKDLDGSARKEYQYLYYVCLTQQMSYNEYITYANRFKEQYNSLGCNSFYIYDEIVYNNQLESTANAFSKNNRNDILEDAILLADSGFRVDKNGFAFGNFTVTKNGESSGGTCLGISLLAARSYVGDKYVRKAEFSEEVMYNSYKRMFSTLVSNLTDNYFSDIVNKNCYNYRPDSNELLNYQGSKQSKCFNLDNMKGSHDNDLLTSLTLWHSYGNMIHSYILNNINSNSYYYNRSAPLAFTTVNSIRKELNNKRPIIIDMFTSESLHGHSVVGIALYQSKEDKNTYYLEVYDNNYPLNKTIRGDYMTNYIILQAGKYYDNDALWPIYKPTLAFKPSNGEYFEYSFSQGFKFYSLDWDFLNTNNATNWGQIIPKSAYYKDYDKYIH